MTKCMISYISFFVWESMGGWGYASYNLKGGEELQDLLIETM